MQKSLKIFLRQMEGEAAPCARCSDTERSFSDLLSVVRPILEGDGIAVIYEEMVIPRGSPPGEAGIFLNGYTLKELLTAADRAQFLCHSTKCQPFVSNVREIDAGGGSVCLEAPEILFRKAFLRAFED